MCGKNGDLKKPFMTCFFLIDGGMEYENVGRFEWILVLVPLHGPGSILLGFRCVIDPLWPTYMFEMFSLEL